MDDISERVLEMRSKQGTDELVEHLLTHDRTVARYVLRAGIETIAARDRRKTRREIKLQIQPHFSTDAKGVVRFTKDTIASIIGSNRRFVDEWLIGGLVLGDLTKEELIAEADRENRAGSGHWLNAQIYAAFAEPLEAGQKMRSYWSYTNAEKLVKDMKKKQAPATASP